MNSYQAVRKPNFIEWIIVSPIQLVGEMTVNFVSMIGELTLFFLNALSWYLFVRLAPLTFWGNMYRIGVLSLPVILITGAFIGMVLSVQSYDQLKMMGMENFLGSVVNVSLVKELGPVLAATMLAGRVGSAMAAELGTMKVTEQIDALKALGADPIHYLVVPRMLCCVILIPILTLFADGIGIITGWMFSTTLLKIDSFYYWHYSNTFVTLFDVISGLVKSLFFGAAIGLVACQRGFKATAGAEGVGKAATESFVFSFVLILFLDFLLGVVSSGVYTLIYGPGQGG